MANGDLDTSSAVAAYLNNREPPPDPAGLAQSAKLSFSSAIDAVPDREAQLRAASQRTGVPLASARANPDDVLRNATLSSMDFNGLAQYYPSTAKLIADQDAARIAHDDVGNLTKIEETLGFLKDSGSAMVAGLYGTSVGITGVAQAGADVLSKFVTGPLTGTVLPEDIGGRMAQGLSQYRQSIEATQRQWAPKSSTILERGWYSGLQSLSQNLTTLPLALLTGNPEIALGPMVAQVGGQAYGQARDKGIGVLPSLSFAASQSAIEYATEKLPVSWLLKDLKTGTSFGKTLLHQMASEVPGEQIATVFQDLNEWAVLNPDKPFTSYLADRPSAAAETLIATLVGTIGQTSIIKGLDTAMGHASGQDAQAQQSEQGAQFLAQINQLAAASKLQQRDADTFEKFVEQATQDGPVQDVYIDGNTLMQSGVAQRVAQVSPSVAAQIDEAVRTGGDVRIPVAEYAARIAPTEFAQPLLDHLKTDPAGMSRSQAQEYLQTSGEQLQQDIEKSLAGQQADDTVRQSVEAVRDNIRGQLAGANRFTPQVNEAYATLVGEFYANAAARAGVTPEQMFERYPLRVQAESVTGGQQFDQTKFGDLLSSAKESIKKALSLSKGDKRYTASHVLMPVFAEEVAEAAVVGLDIAGYQHAIDGSAIRHTFKNHGNEEKELRRGQLAITETDLEAIPDILATPDKTIYGLKNGIGRDMIVYLKTMPDGTTIYLEEVRSGRKTLTAQSMRKYPRTTAADSIVKSLRPTSETLPGDGVSIVDTPVPRNGQTLNQGARGAFNPSTNTISLLKAADLSTFLHESGHFFLEVQMDMAAKLAGEAATAGPESLSEGERQIVADANALLQWFGVTDLTTWHGLDFEEKRSYHEQFARGFESYLFEGNAPNIEVQGLFQRFRAWMVNVYKELKALNVELTPEVRGVMDRMLATDEQIKAAEYARSMMPLFESAQAAGMTPEGFAAYQALGKDATQQAQADLSERGLRDMQWLHNAHARELKRLQKEVEALRAVERMDVRREIMSQPVYRAWQFLTGRISAEDKSVSVVQQAEAGKTGNQINLESAMSGRLDRKVLRGIYGADADAVKTLDARRMLSNEGLHPDLVAELFGFTSGDELVKALADAQPPKLEIDALTDLRMLERHGDLATPEAQSRAADRAIHNDLRARMISAEHKALADAVGPSEAAGADRNGRARSSALLPRVAREFVAAMVGRLAIRNLRPGQYAAAETRAARAAEKALRESDLERAAAEKRNQLVNNYATKATYAAMDEVEAGVRYLKKFDSDGTRKNLDIDYLEQIDAILARFDLRRSQSLKAIDKRTSLSNWIEARTNEGTEPDIPPWLAAEANREHYKNLTIEQFRGLLDSIKQIEHLGRLKHQLLTAKDQRDMDAIVSELRDTIKENAHGRVFDNEKRNTLGSSAAFLARGFLAAHRKMANLVREMDGFKDGGRMWEYIIRPMNEAGNKEASMRADATKRLYELTKPVLKQGRMGGKGTSFPSVGKSLNRGERLAIALNWGNDGNRQRLLDGRGWTIEQVQPVLNSLTASEWHFVQGVWDFFESYRPEIAAKERRVMGKEPDWIEPTPVVLRTADGQDVSLRGGYYPVKYDPNQSGEAGAHADAEQAKAMMRAAYTAATTRRSFTKSRADRVMNRPLLLTFDGIYQGANEVIHDLAWHEWLIDVNKLARRLDSPIRNGYGAESVTIMKRTIEDIARGDKPATNAVESSLNHLRTGATVAGLGWNLTTAMLQPLGVLQSMVRIGPVWVARGLREFYGNPTQMLAKADEVQAKSEFMRNRARTMSREINDVQNQLTKGKGAVRTAVEGSFFVLIQKLQASVDYPTWLGAYEKALADPVNIRADGTVDDARAVGMADQAVIDAQGEGQTKDLAQVQRGHPGFKLFTNFYSYFNVALNMAVDRARATDFKKPGDVIHLAGDYVLLAILPAVLDTLLRTALKGGGDGDDDALLKDLIQNQISYLMGLFVGVREMTSAATYAAGVGGFGYGGPAGVRFFAEITKLGQQIGQGEADQALAKSANNVAGLLFHYPAGQVSRFVEGAAALLDGRSKNPLAPLVGVPYKR